MPTSHRILAIPEAHLLCDLHGIRASLQATAEYGGLLEAAWGTLPPLDIDQIDALSTAAVCRYARCFEGGVHTRLGEDDIAAVGPAWRAFHRQMMVLREKHFCRSSQQFDESRVTVAVSEPPRPRQVLQISVDCDRVPHLSREQAISLRSLARILQDYLRAKIEAEERRLRAMVGNMPEDAVYELPLYDKSNKDQEAPQ